MTDAQAALSLTGVVKSFPGRTVLRGVDLDIAPGRSLVVIGASGAGKSVLLKCVLGLTPIDAGAVHIGGVDLARADAPARKAALGRIGMLFQGAALFDSLRVWENVAFRLVHAQGEPRASARRKAIERLADVGLPPEVGELYPAALSGGMRKRVALARAIAGAPDILFFDEPTTGLDPISADVINRLIVARVRALGASALTITHDMASARKIADEVAMLHEGRIIWRGPPETLGASGDAYVDQFANASADGPIHMALKGA